MKNFKNKKTLQIVLLVVIAVVTLGVGYAAISAVNLIINGNATASVKQENFKVHFTEAQTISGSTGVSGTSSIDTQDDTKAMFDVTGLTKIGDYAEAVYTVRNDSEAIGAEITLLVTNSNSEYFKVTETIQDDKLQAGEETTAKVKVEMIKTPVNDVETTSIIATLTALPLENANAIGGNPASKIAGGTSPESFASDSWLTIKTAVQSNDMSKYNIGDIKELVIGDKTYRLRIINKTTTENCNDITYSQTACGFVVEFVDVLGNIKMNDDGTNAGGYPETKAYRYLANTLYKKLPDDLKNAIIPTRVISGHGSVDSENFVSTDNLYLLSGVEVLGSDSWDTAAGTTRQMDYYQDPSSDKHKEYNSQALAWWLRTAYYETDAGFRTIVGNGDLAIAASNASRGLAPAFRIG